MTRPVPDPQLVIEIPGQPEVADCRQRSTSRRNRSRRWPRCPLMFPRYGRRSPWENHGAAVLRSSIKTSSPEHER